MNAREKKLLVALIVIVGLPALYFGGKRWWWDPLVVYHEQAAKLDDDVKKVNDELGRFQRGQAKLNKARLRSLPAIPEQAAAEYNQYLQPMLIDSGLTVEETTPPKTDNIPKVKPVTPIQGVTATGHQVLNFTVRASGELPALIKALEQMQKEPYEHRIKSLTIDRDTSKKASNKLNIQMNIEVLLVAGTKNKSGTARNPELAQAIPDDRQYAQIAKRNIFEGAPPPLPPESEEKYVPTENTPQYVYLTTTLPEEQVFYLRNHLNNKREMRWTSKPGTGYDTFVIWDEGGKHSFFRAKVLRVEQRRVFIQIKEKVFTVQIGKSLADMERYGFSKSWIELEDEGLFDHDFMKEEMGKAKKNADDNKGNAKKKGQSTKKAK